MALLFFNDTATTQIYTLSLHDALPICLQEGIVQGAGPALPDVGHIHVALDQLDESRLPQPRSHLQLADRKSTRLNSSHANISYAVFWLKNNKAPIKDRKSKRLNSSHAN